MNKNWTAAEIDFLRKHYLTVSKDDLILQLPNHSWASIRAYANKYLGLSRQSCVSKKKWSQTEVEEILKKISQMNIQEMADYFHVTYNQMCDKIHKLGLKRKEASGEMWSQEEDTILQQHYEYAPRDYILEALPNREWNPIQQHAKKVLNLDRKSRDNIFCDYRFFDTWTEKSAYILGFIMADGYLAIRSEGSSQSRLRIVVAAFDADIIYKIAAALKFRGLISFLNHKDKKTVECNISIQNIWLLQQIKNKGIPVLNKSYVATFPTDIPDNMIRHFIRGIIDGDGFVVWRKRYSSLRNKDYDYFQIGWCGTQDIVQQVRDHLPFDCNNNAVTKNTGSADYYCHISGKKAFQICEWLYKDATIFLDRKYEAYCQAKQKYAPSSE